MKKLHTREKFYSNNLFIKLMLGLILEFKMELALRIFYNFYTNIHCNKSKTLRNQSYKILERISDQIEFLAFSVYQALNIHINKGLATTLPLFFLINNIQTITSLSFKRCLYHNSINIVVAMLLYFVVNS